MEPWIAIVLVIAALLVLLAMECPVAFALATSGTLGLLLFRDAEYAGSVLGSAPFEVISDFSLTIVPMFVLIGVFAIQGRLAAQIYEIANHVFRRVPGGLGCATVAACAGFAAVSGSSVATAATMASLSIDQMRGYGYSKSFAGGVVACAGTLGVLIPPSIILAFYAILTGESTGQMLAAGVVPGIITAAAYCAYILLSQKRLGLRQSHELAELQKSRTDSAQHTAATGSASPTAGNGPPSGRDHADIAADGEVSPAQKPGLRQLPWRGAVRIAILFAIILGGIYTGIFTAAESGALGALAALVMMVIEIRRESIYQILRNLRSALAETAQVTSMVFAVVIGSAVFSAFLVQSGTPRAFASWITSVDVVPLIVVLLMVGLLLILGMGLDSLSILIITMPLMYPVVTELGFDGIWFGIIAVKAIEIGLVTPPVGVTCYVVAGAVKKLSVEDVFKGVWPFVVMDLLVVGLFFVFPEIVLWLPAQVAP